MALRENFRIILIVRIKRSEFTPNRIPPAEPLAGWWHQLNGVFPVRDLRKPGVKLSFLFQQLPQNLHDSF